MRIIRLQAEGFKRLVAVDITPDGELIEVRGNNGEGKSSVLDAIFAALGGAEAAPLKPVRDGEEYAAIKVALGEGDAAELIVTRYFTDDGTTRLKVENGEGAVFTKGQTMLDALVGSISFDPLAFARMDAKAQAEELRRLIKLDVDLDALARADAADKEARRDVNRDGRNLAPRVAAIVLPADTPEEAPDKAAIVAELARAGETNAGIERERQARRSDEEKASLAAGDAQKMHDDARELRRRADALDSDAAALETRVKAERARLADLPDLPEPVDTVALSARIAEVDKIIAAVAQRKEKERLTAEYDALKAKSEGFTKAIEDRAAQRAKALSSAVMPVEGLALARICDVVPGDIAEDLIVTFGGVPFTQSSGAEQLRVSTRIAMAANPKLRVLRVKDGSLLDPTGLKLLAELAKDNDFQIWGEFVGEGEGVGVIMESGAVKGAPEPERIEAPKRRKKGEAGEGEAQPGDVIATVAETPKRKPGAMREIVTPTPEPGKLL
jgi:hypothetical protein